MTPPRQNPFPGLRPFRPDESTLFFGRDEQIGEALDRLMQRNLLAVVGMSGCGKSSLVTAGMVPALEMGLAGNPERKWRIEIMRPGDGPLRELERCLGLGPLADRTYALRDTVKQHLASNQNLLLVVDQFEEIFAFRDRMRRGGGNEADLFVNYLLTATEESDGQIYVILTMRSDYLGECARFHDLPEALNDGQYLVPRMTRAQLQEAIESPLESVADEGDGVRFHPGLVQKLLNDCDEEPDNLPLLQHLLRRLFEEWERNGGQGLITSLMAKAVGELSGALNQDAEAVYSQLTLDQQRCAELLFRRITESRQQADGTKDDRPVRRPQTVAHLASLAKVSQEALRAVIDRFAQRGLLVLRAVHPKGPTDPDDKVDLPHECLCWKWLRLKGWIEAEADDAKRLRFLSDSVGKTHLLGVALEEARRWQQDGRLEGLWCERYVGAEQRAALTAWVSESQQLLDDEHRRLREDEQRQRAATRDKTMRRVFTVFWGVSLLLLAVALFQWFNARNALRSAQLAEESARREAKIASERADAVLSFSRAQTELKAANSQAEGLRNDLGAANLSQSERTAKLNRLQELVDRLPDLKGRAEVASANAALIAAGGDLLQVSDIRRDDVFDVSQGIQVTAFSGNNKDGMALRMFGAVPGDATLGASGRGSGPAEDAVTFFGDGKPAGYPHSVEWQTNRLVTIRSVGLFARHDEMVDGYNFRRAFSTFKLYGRNGKDWMVLAEYSPELPYGQGENKNVLAACLDVKQLQTREFKAEFMQAVDILGQFSAPRVIALDGYNQTHCGKQD